MLNQKLGRIASVLPALGLLSVAASHGTAYAKDVSYKASVEVIERSESSAERCQERLDAGKSCELVGKVFHDRNRDGIKQRRERGISGVLVSNGQDVVVTRRDGSYRLPITQREGGTTVFITKPSGWDLPVDEHNVPQFHYHHLPEGSPPLRFGGLAPTGALPKAVNFPLVRGRNCHRFKIAVSGDPQPYSNNEVGYVRDTLVRDMVTMGTDDIELVMIEGDVMGDDLGLFPRFKSILSTVQSPLYMVGGNHDLDFDAKSDAHSFDTFRREWGPTYYSFDIGDVHFIGLDDVRYPCTTETDNQDGLHNFCDNPDRPTYNGVIDDRQMQWLMNDIARVPRHKLIVLNMHIPLVSYVDQNAAKHQVDNTAELYELLEGRRALALSGHTHTLEQIRPGENYAGWDKALSEPIGASPFPQIVTGAASGSWWSGDLDNKGIPMAYQRLGAPRGYLVFEFHGNRFRDTFKATGRSIERQMSVSLRSPTFTDWYDQLLGWLQSDAATRSAVTPVGIHDLPDPSIVTADDMSRGTDLVANVWNGSRDSEVWAQIDGGSYIEMQRTQSGTGESFFDYPDPFAVTRQMYVTRYAVSSESGNDLAQGFRLFRNASFRGEAQPLPEWMITTRSNHLWRVALPQDLKQGAHTARIVTRDRHGQIFEEFLTFEVMNERPPAFFRSELFQ